MANLPPAQRGFCAIGSRCAAHARIVVLALLALCAARISLALAAEGAPDWLNAQLGGASATTQVATQNAYGQPAALATGELRLFSFGNRVFNTNWVAAPASVAGFDGLGPRLQPRIVLGLSHARWSWPATERRARSAGLDVGAPQCAGTGRARCRQSGAALRRPAQREGAAGCARRGAHDRDLYRTRGPLSGRHALSPRGAGI